MKRYILIQIFLMVCITALSMRVNAQTKNDTVVTYYKFGKYNYGPFAEKVKSVDSADYIRIIYPDDDPKLYKMDEFYKNGEKKYVGKIDKYSYDNRNLIKSSGYGVNYYPNGRRKSLSNWKDGVEIGLEYLYTPQGKLYATIKYDPHVINRTLSDSYFWDFYDNQGNQTCKDGNGVWTIYDVNRETPIFTGNIKNGYMDGPWKGAMLLDDSIKYICNFKQNVMTRGVGFDKNNKSYPFKKFIEHADYSKGNYVFFVMDLNRHLKLPKDVSGKEMNVDTVHFSFIVKKDGSLSELQPLNNNPKLKDALNEAVVKCGTWTPTEICGIPYETNLVLTLKVTQGYLIKTVSGKGKIINMPDIPGGF